MSVLPILTWPDLRLSQPCEPIADITEETRALAADMLDTMYAAPGRGLAAPQVGVLQRLFVMDPTWKDGVYAPMVLINPMVEWTSGVTKAKDEACLSIPGITASVTRPVEITLSWTALDGGARRETFSGFAATCAQHELDHLDGLVTFDRVAPDIRAVLLAEYRG